MKELGREAKQSRGDLAQRLSRDRRPTQRKSRAGRSRAICSGQYLTYDIQWLIPESGTLAFFEEDHPRYVKSFNRVTKQEISGKVPAGIVKFLEGQCAAATLKSQQDGTAESIRDAIRKLGYAGPIIVSFHVAEIAIQNAQAPKNAISIADTITLLLKSCSEGKGFAMAFGVAVEVLASTAWVPLKDVRFNSTDAGESAVVPESPKAKQAQNGFAVACDAIEALSEEDQRILLEKLSGRFDNTTVENRSFPRVEQFPQNASFKSITRSLRKQASVGKPSEAVGAIGKAITDLGDHVKSMRPEQKQECVDRITKSLRDERLMVLFDDDTYSTRLRQKGGIISWRTNTLSDKRLTSRFDIVPLTRKEK